MHLIIERFKSLKVSSTSSSKSYASNPLKSRLITKDNIFPSQPQTPYIPHSKSQLLATPSKASTFPLTISIFPSNLPKNSFPNGNLK